MKIHKLKLVLCACLLGLPIATPGGEPDSRQDLILEYLDDMGIIDSIDLQVESLFAEYVEYYSHLPNDFWRSAEVVDLFGNFKVDLLRGYTEAIENEISDDELAFLVEFYATEEGRRAVSLGRRLDPILVAAAADAGKTFSAIFADIVEQGEY